MVASTAPRSPVEARCRFSRHTGALVEMLLGCFLLGVATLAGLAFVHRPWPNRVDAFGFRLLPAHVSSRWAADVVHLGSSTVLIAGAAVLCVAAALSGNRMRAVSCLIAPIGALLIVQSVAKPLVGRHFEGTTALSYPSGTVAAVAALAAATFLVVPRRAKPPVAVAGVVVVTVICAAVVLLRWHYPTDALGGACVGAGAVFALDGLLGSIRNPAAGRAVQQGPGADVAPEASPSDAADPVMPEITDSSEAPGRQRRGDASQRSG
jgi:membrane-associated phospholipid phosphatase